MSRYIDADALIAQMEADAEHIEEPIAAMFAYAAINDVKHAPTIEPERKKGEWNFIGNQMFECSECGTCYTQSQFYQMRVRISDAEFPKFCPNCGAKMEEGEQDAERTS